MEDIVCGSCNCNIEAVVIICNKPISSGINVSKHMWHVTGRQQHVAGKQQIHTVVKASPVCNRQGGCMAERSANG